MIVKEELLNIIKGEELDIGFNNKIYFYNQYVIKVCYNNYRESKFSNEIDFYKEHNFYFMPKLIKYDKSKSDIPYYYIIISRIEGYNLFSVWSTLTNNERYLILKQLKDIMKIFHVKDTTRINYKEIYFKEFDEYFNNIKCNKIFSPQQILFIEKIRNYVFEHFYMESCYRIHGDLQFNNIIYLPNGTIKLIDFEHVEIAPLEKEFYHIFRMIDDPESFIKNDNNCYIDVNSFKLIKDKIYDLFPEICNNILFEYNIFLFEFLNSLRWVIKYPEHKKYHEILFEKVKKYGGFNEKNNK